MKKITALLCAATFLFAVCGCENKVDVSGNDTVGDVTGAVETETATEPPYLELTEADFTPVDINYTVTDDEPPTELSSTDLSGLSFGERLSPCKIAATENPAAYSRYGSYLYSDNAEWQERYDKARKKALETPSKGAVEKAIFSDGKLYLTVNFDDWCGQHDSSLFRYDIGTGKMDELATHTGLEYNGCFTGLALIHGKLMYYEAKENDTGSVDHAEPGEVFERAGLIAGTYGVYSAGEIADVSSTVYEVDSESGDISEVLSTDCYINGFYESENGFRFNSYIAEQTSAETLPDGTEQPVYSYTIEYYEYDLETGEVSKVQSEAAEEARIIMPEPDLCDGNPVEITGGYDGEKYVPVTVKTQYWTIATDLTYYSGIYTWRDKLSIVVEDGYGTDYMYTYDIARKERLKMRFEGYNGAGMIKTNDGLIAITGMSSVGDSNKCRMYYIMPLLGMSFRIAEANNCITGFCDDTAFLLTLRYEEYEYDDEIFVGYYSNYGVSTPDKLYWFRA